jgi:hypothetical protein
VLGHAENAVGIAHDIVPVLFNVRVQTWISWKIGVPGPGYNVRPPLGVV